MFALSYVRTTGLAGSGNAMPPKNEWELFLGVLMADRQQKQENRPATASLKTQTEQSTSNKDSWMTERATAIARLEQHAPAIYSQLSLSDQQIVMAFSAAQDPEQLFTQTRLTDRLSDFQKLIVLQVKDTPNFISN